MHGLRLARRQSNEQCSEYTKTGQVGPRRAKQSASPVVVTVKDRVLVIPPADDKTYGAYLHVGDAITAEGAMARVLDVGLRLMALIEPDREG